LPTRTNFYTILSQQPNFRHTKVRISLTKKEKCLFTIVVLLVHLKMLMNLEEYEKPSRQQSRQSCHDRLSVKMKVVSFTNNNSESKCIGISYIMFRIVFWDVLPCKIIVDRCFRGAFCLHHQGWRQYAPLKRRSTIILIIRDVGSTHLWNVGRQSFYTAVHPRRQFWTSYSPPWELEISHLIYCLWDKAKHVGT
jgi:hypothetical protein